MVEDFKAAIIGRGQEAIEQRLAQAASDIHTLVETYEPLAQYDRITSAAAKEATPQGNQTLQAIAHSVTEHAAKTVTTLRDAEMFIYMHVPVVSDGNNFGVDVQLHAAKELKDFRSQAEAMMRNLDAYLQARGDALVKIMGSATSDIEKDTTTETTTKQEGEKQAERTEMQKVLERTKETEKKSVVPQDYEKLVVALDVRHFYTFYHNLVDLRDICLRAEDMCTKNLRRLQDPRGEGAGGNRGVMSMF